jgi:DNA-binding transcriptional ArsR family regulator
MREFMKLTKALADETRVRILLALRDGELCVCQITALFGMAPSTVSKHLSILHQAGLLVSRKAERWVYYRLPGQAASLAAKKTLNWVVSTVKNEEGILRDAEHLKRILKCEPAALCKRQNHK